MKRSREDEEKEIVRVELKYCERCGSLWVRECGAGVVYCGNCQPRIADLPIPKKKRRRATLPVRRHALVEDYEVQVGDEAQDLEAAGGVA
jgi:ribosomal protein L37AE/L43A